MVGAQVLYKNTIMTLDIPYHLENFIGGNFIGPLSGQFLDNVNPATAEIVGQIPNSNEKDIDVAVMAGADR
jgi:aminomuconate-semialdehyde/2-hydroxymuconate-6-semialdehyde dehydrogenase